MRRWFSTLLLLLTMMPVPTADAAPICDPAYVDHCLPPAWLEPDIDCSTLYTAGIWPVRLAKLGWDPHGLDDDGDGLGCEGIWGW
jgi:hypothetical protein